MSSFLFDIKPNRNKYRNYFVFIMKLSFLEFLKEARRNPELNPKTSINQEIQDYVDSSTEPAFVSFTSLDKLGINPNSVHKTPIGIYAFPASYVLEKTKDVSTKLSEFISVKDFGAVGDGIVDDTSAIQATLVAANGRRVLFESGKTYLITSQLIYSGNVDIESDGATPATIFHNGQSFDPIKFTGSFFI